MYHGIGDITYNVHLDNEKNPSQVATGQFKPRVLSHRINDKLSGRSKRKDSAIFYKTKQASYIFKQFYIFKNLLIYVIM